LILFTLPDNDPIALIWTEDGYSVRSLINKSFESVTGYHLPQNTIIMGMTYCDGAILLNTGEGLSVYSGGDMLPVFMWADIGIKRGEADVVGITENADIVYLNLSGGSLYVIRSVATAFPQKELTLAVIVDSVPFELDNAVAEFNATNNEYKVNIVRYESLDQLNVQIIAGNIPDIIETTYDIPFDSFAGKGLFEDLNPYIDNDPEIALVPTIHRILSTEDSLFRVTPGVMPMSLVGCSDFVGSEQGWTFEEMKQYLASAPKGVTAFPAVWNKESILIFSLYQNLDDFIDWESGRVLFDTPDFKELLEFVNTVPDKTPAYKEEVPLLLEGKQLVMHIGHSIFENFVDIDHALEGKAVYKGFPSSGKNSGIMRTGEFTLAMSSKCANKDGAWSFIRDTLLIEDDRLIDGTFRAIPIIQSKFDLAVELAMTEPRFDAAPMTQEQYEKFMTFINGVDEIVNGSTTLERIVSEEIPAYFNGDKTVKEVANIIQARAQIYVSEQSN